MVNESAGFDRPEYEGLESSIHENTVNNRLPRDHNRHDARVSDWLRTCCGVFWNVDRRSNRSCRLFPLRTCSEQFDGRHLVIFQQ